MPLYHMGPEVPDDAYATLITVLSLENSQSCPDSFISERQRISLLLQMLDAYIATMFIKLILLQSHVMLR